jgi:hypothetical protein
MEHSASKAKLSQEMAVTFQSPGLYGYRLLPHFGMGMVGLTEVDDSTPNLEAAREATLPPLATKRMATLSEHATQPAATQSGIAASR